MYFKYKDELKVFFLDVCRKFCKDVAENFTKYEEDQFKRFLAFKHKFPKYFKLQRSFQLPSYETVEMYIKEMILE